MWPFIAIPAALIGYFLYTKAEAAKLTTTTNASKAGTPAGQVATVFDALKSPATPAAADHPAPKASGTPLNLGNPSPLASLGLVPPGAVPNAQNAPEINALNETLAAMQNLPVVASLTKLVTGNQQGTVTTQTDSLRIRSSPSSVGNIRGSVPKGAQITITGGVVSGSGSTSGWYPVLYNGVDGFASADFITIN